MKSYNPWVSLSWLVTGRTLGGTRLYPQSNLLDRETALRLWTERNAWYSSEEVRRQYYLSTWQSSAALPLPPFLHIEPAKHEHA
jgi:hypothetical protein